MSAAAAFERFNFAANADWRSVEDALYFSTNDAAEQARILTKRKKKWYKANIDESFNIDEPTPTPAAEPARNESTKSNTASGSFQPSASASPRSSVPPPAASAAPAAGNSTRSKYSAYIAYAQMALHVLIILNVLTYLLPLLGAEEQAPSFWRVMMLNLVVQALYLLKTHGRPQWNAEYGRAMFQDEQAHYFFLSIVLMNASPMFLLLAPFLSRSVLFVSGGLKQILPNKVPRLYALLQKPIEAVVSRYTDIMRTNALLEVLGGIMLIFNIVTAQRNIMLIFGFWQYLRIRYMLSEDSKLAFATVRGKIDGWTNNPMCPAIIRTVWSKLLSTLESYTDQAAMAAQANQQGGGLMSKCTIM